MMIDPKHPFFAKPWRRWAATLAPLAWSVVEMSLGNTGWAAMFAAGGAYTGYVLLWAKPSD